LALTHYFTHFRTLGGVESILHRHHVSDQAGNLASRFVLFFEDRQLQQKFPRTFGLGWSWRTTIWQARRCFAEFAASQTPHVAMYHNLWGLAFLAEFDRATRRLGLLHSDWPGLEQDLSAQRGLLDGMLCVSEALQVKVLRQLPELNPRRVELIPYPITNFPPAPPRLPLENRPLVIGFCGRIVKEQKRVDRLPPLVRLLESAGLDFRLELLGTGNGEKWLHRQFGCRPNVIFHGRKQGDAYRKILESWDGIVFTSDYEGLPIALLEALIAGVLPFYPEINSGGDRYAKEVRPVLLYPSGNLDALTRALVEIKRCPEMEVQALRTRCWELATPHSEGRYFQQFAEFVQRMERAPRISAVSAAPRPRFFTDYFPFALLRRVYPRGFYCRPAGSPV